MYKKVKGTIFKNKHVLMENIHRTKAEKHWGKTLPNKFESRRAKNKAKNGMKVL